MTKGLLVLSLWPIGADWIRGADPLYRRIFRSNPNSNFAFEASPQPSGVELAFLCRRGRFSGRCWGLGGVRCTRIRSRRNGEIRCTRIRSRDNGEIRCTRITPLEPHLLVPQLLVRLHYFFCLAMPIKRRRWSVEQLALGRSARPVLSVFRDLLQANN